ncbi:MAG: sugar phosphate isomerase/epimerase [Enterobacter hormaechei]
MKIATQTRPFSLTAIMEKFKYIKAMGFDGYEIDGRLLVEHPDEVKALSSHRSAGHDGVWRIRWLDRDFIEERRLNSLSRLNAFWKRWQKWAARAIIVPAAWGCLPALPPMTSPRSLDGDRKAVSASCAGWMR